jgi:glycine/sarcosine N-methyltransferase
MYDEISSEYDHFVNWDNRLAFELPFLEQQLLSAPRTTGQTSPRVLDAACGTAMHAIALARRGYPSAGADLSAGMIAQAKTNALAAGLELPLVVAGFGDLTQAFGPASFDALLCLGNSLPHLLSLPDLDAALLDFAHLLRPGGVIVLQNRNFDAILARQQRWMEPQSYQQGDDERLYVRFYDFLPDGLINFHMLTLTRRTPAAWQQSITTSQLYPISQSELTSALARSGFARITSYGGLNGSPFDSAASPNLVVTAAIPR